MAKEVDLLTSSPYSALSWHQVWFAAVRGDFQYLLDASESRIGLACLWIAGSAFIGLLIRLGLDSIINSKSSLFVFVPELAFLIIVVGPIAAVGGYMVTAGLIHMFARVCGGVGTYPELFYLFAAFLAPLSLIVNVLTPIPLLNCLTLPVGLYSLVLYLKAIATVHDFGYGRAILSYLLGMLLAALVVIAILLIVGPIVGQVFTNIVENLSAHMP